MIFASNQRWKCVMNTNKRVNKSQQNFHFIFHCHRHLLFYIILYKQQFNNGKCLCDKRKNARLSTNKTREIVIKSNHSELDSQFFKHRNKNNAGRWKIFGSSSHLVICFVMHVSFSWIIKCNNIWTHNTNPKTKKRKVERERRANEGG